MASLKFLLKYSSAFIDFGVLDLCLIASSKEMQSSLFLFFNLLLFCTWDLYSSFGVKFRGSTLHGDSGSCISILSKLFFSLPYFDYVKLLYTIICAMIRGWSFIFRGFIEHGKALYFLFVCVFWKNHKSFSYYEMYY